MISETPRKSAAVICGRRNLLVDDVTALLFFASRKNVPTIATLKIVNAVNGTPAQCERPKRLSRMQKRNGKRSQVQTNGALVSVPSTLSRSVEASSLIM